MDGRCEDCQHWAEAGWRDNNFVIPDGYGKCAAIPGLSGFTMEKGCPPITTLAALIPNGDPFESSSLITRPDFGCVLFEEKE